MATARTDARADRTPAQLFALVFGAVYLLVGAIGFAVSEDFYGADPDAELTIFALNGLHNVVHLALGVVWLAAATRDDWARMINLLFGAVLLLVGIVGLTGAFDELLNIEDAAEPDNYLHLGTAVLSLYFGRR